MSQNGTTMMTKATVILMVIVIVIVLIILVNQCVDQVAIELCGILTERPRVNFFITILFQ